MSNIKLVVEVCHAHNLPRKDGAGSASAFVEVVFDDLRMRTKTKSKDLNPVWNERLEFTVTDRDVLDEQPISVHVFTEKTGGGRQFIGKTKVEGHQVHRWGSSGADVAMEFQLKSWYPFPMTKGSLFLKVYYVDETTTTNAHPKGINSKDASATVSRSVEKAIASRNGDWNIHKSNGEPDPWGNWRGDDAAAMSRLSHATAPSEFDVRATSSTHRRDDSLVRRHDLVARMKYLFVRIERAKDLISRDANGSSDPFVEVKVGNVVVNTAVVNQNLNPEWREVIAIAEDRMSAEFLEITVWDKDMVGKDFLGFIAFEIGEIPERHPPDSPLAPQWYKLESRNGHKRVGGELMLSVWMGTQADEAFPHARQSDSGWEPQNRSKIYLSPRLWYLRVAVHEAQDLFPHKENRHPDAISVVLRLGRGAGASQVHRTQTAMIRQSGNIVWNEEFIFVAPEPFADEFLHVSVVDKVSSGKVDEPVATLKIPLITMPKRTNARRVDSKWYDLDRESKDLKEVVNEVTDKLKGQGKRLSRILLNVCIEGGYHVLDESTLYISDARPTDKRLWKTPVAMLEIGLVGASGLVSNKTRDGRACTDAYCVVKYGPKWVRTRTVMDSASPQWNEQYTWEVYDPCTVLTVGVFDNHHLGEGLLTAMADKVQNRKDEIIGKVRIRLSTLETDRTYSHKYPLLMLERSGVKPKGDVELVLRLTCMKRFNMMQIYLKPLLPKLHYLKPLNPRKAELLREAATQIVVSRLERSEPPVRPEVVRFMLDVDACKWSTRRSKANWYRISRVLGSLFAVWTWFKDVRDWKNPLTTVLVHVLYFILVWYPELMLPTFFLYMFLIGTWQYRFRPRHPSHMDVELSLANTAHAEELDEEFDPIPSTKQPDIVRLRYDRLRVMAGKMQTVVGDIATQLERFHALLNWRDPRATTIFIFFCLIAAIVLYITPFRVIAILAGIYFLRHPRFRDGMPPIPINFFKRLPGLCDKML